jgi:glycosyltransferase involved in cell wall biosynthesis
MNNFVSVIVPVFNRSSTVGDALESLMNQTLQSWEALVVDNGSSDDSVKIVNEYTLQDRRIGLIRHDQRKGAPAARNIGIRAAKGDWITFLDSDDHLLSDSIEVRLRLAIEKRLQVVHSDCLVVKTKNAKPEPMGVRPIRGWVYKLLLRGPATTGYFLFSRDAFSRIGTLDETLRSYQDWDLAIRLARYYEFGFVDKPTFIWNCFRDDTISNNLLRTAEGYEQVFTKHFWSILRFLGPRVLAWHYQMAAHLYSEAKDEDNARRCSIKALLLWPSQPKAILRGIQRLLQSGL